jgi:serine/threonine protein kinase
VNLASEIEAYDESELNLSPETFPLERYKPLEVIGQGASGMVYRCRDRLLGKQVAIKCLNAATAEQLISFQQEAKATSLLNHPGVVSIMDFGSTAHGAAFMVLEYFEGESLQRVLETRGPLSQAVAVPIFMLIADALRYTHSKNVFHRDLKSSNILLVLNEGEQPGVRIIDFGIASIKEAASEASAETERSLIGTPAYMSPDQARGLAFDARSEVYNFGCVMFEALTGRAPFEGETALETIRMHAQDEPPGLSDVRPDCEYAPGLQALILKCLAKEPIDRYQSMTELLAALELLQASLVGAHGDSDPGDRRSGRKFYRAAVAAALLTTATLLAFLLLRDIEHRSQSETVSSSRKEARTRVDKSAARLSNLFQEDNGYFWSTGSEITDDDIVALCRKRGGAIDSLKLDSRASDMKERISKRGWGALARTKVSELNLSQYGLIDDELREIAKIKSLKELKISRNRITNQGVAHLAHHPSLSSLTLSGTEVDDRCIDTLKTLPALYHVDIEETALSDVGLHRMKDSKLSSISIGSTRVTDEGMRFIAQMPNLRSLYLEHLELTDIGLRHLSRLPLNCLSVDSHSNFTDDSLRLVVKSFPHLKVLLISETKVTGEGLELLPQLGELERLSCINLRLTDETAAPIFKLKKLNELTMSINEITDRSVFKMAEMPALKTVVLSDCRVTAAGIARLREKGIEYEITQAPSSSYEIIKMFDHPN